MLIGNLWYQYLTIRTLRAFLTLVPLKKENILRTWVPLPMLVLSTLFPHPKSFNNISKAFLLQLFLSKDLSSANVLQKQGILKISWRVLRKICLSVKVNICHFISVIGIFASLNNVCERKKDFRTYQSIGLCLGDETSPLIVGYIYFWAHGVFRYLTLKFFYFT